MKGIKIHVINYHNDSKDANNELIDYIMSPNFSPDITVKGMKKQIQNKIVKCEQCDFTCSTQNILNLHIGRKHRNEIYQEDEIGEYSECDYIGTGESIKCHSKAHTAVQPFTCNKCNFSCITRKVLNRHISGNHGDETNFEDIEDEIEKVSECDYVGTAKQLKSHSESESQKTEKCTQCNYIGTAKGLNSHIKAHKVKQFTCEQCHYSCLTRKVLNTHIVRKHGDEVFTCSECDYKGLSFIGLSRHLKVHNKYGGIAQLYLKCPICREDFIDKNNSKVSQKSLKFNCAKCNISFFTEVTLKKSWFNCGKCNKYFKTTNEIKNHVNKGHKSFSKWSCLQCNYSCQSKSDLRRHNSVHEQKQIRHISVQEPKHRFICLECGLSYDDKADLISHMVDMGHTGGKPYSCTKCKVQFNTSIGLKDHMDSHDSDALYQEDAVEERELFTPDTKDSGTEIIHCSDYQVKSEYEDETIFIVDPIDIKCEMIVGESETCAEENDKDCFDVKNNFEEDWYKHNDFTIMFNPENIKSEKEICNVRHEEEYIIPNESIVGIDKPVDIGEDMNTLHGCNLRI